MNLQEIFQRKFQGSSKLPCSLERQVSSGIPCGIGGVAHRSFSARRDEALSSLEVVQFVAVLSQGRVGRDVLVRRFKCSTKVNGKFSMQKKQTKCPNLFPASEHGPPRTKETLHELQHRRPHVQQRAVPEEIFEHERERPVSLDRSKFLDSLRSAPRGFSPGPGGRTYEHLKTSLDDTDTTELFLSVCNTLARFQHTS